MFSIRCIVVAVLAVTVAGCSHVAQGQRATLPLVIYDGGNNQNKPYVASGYIGNISAINMDRSYPEAHSNGQTCWKVSYNATGSWGGVMWQNPANDWGDKPGGWDLTGAQKLTFWAQGENGGEVVTFSYGGIRGKPYSDSSSGNLDRVTLTKSWAEYSIDLNGKDLHDIKTGFAWTVQPGKPTTFYLNDIKYE